MVFIHTIAHLVRWGLRNEMVRVVNTYCGFSGMVGSLVTVPIVVLMAGSRKFRQKYKWEVRKGVHMLCFVFGFGITMHTSRLFYIMLTTMAIYTADFLYCRFQVRTLGALFSTIICDMVLTL
jgi:hypothetical protein